MQQNPWMLMLGELELSRTEREAVRRFDQDPEGRSFLPVADILRAHRLADEALELLTQGVERHPQFTVARVVLARELLQKGLVESAWRTLADSPVSLKDNLLAQKLRFRLAVLMDDESSARQAVALLHNNQGLDLEGRRLYEMLEVEGFSGARQRLINEIRGRGGELSLPVSPAHGASLAAMAGGEAHADEPGEAVHGIDAPPRRGAGQGLEAGAQGGPLDDELWKSEESLRGFHVVPLEEIFRPDATNPVAQGQDGVELDSTTLADIFVKQGHYAKALSVYRRMLQLSPNSDLLRRQVAEVARLAKEQREVDLTVDPGLVDRMETVGILDRQIRYLNDLLGRLA